MNFSPPAPESVRERGICYPESFFVSPRRGLRLFRAWGFGFEIATPKAFGVVLVQVVNLDQADSGAAVLSRQDGSEGAGLEARYRCRPRGVRRGQGKQLSLEARRAPLLSRSSSVGSAKDAANANPCQGRTNSAYKDVGVVASAKDESADHDMGTRAHEGARADISQL